MFFFPSPVNIAFVCIFKIKDLFEASLSCCLCKTVRGRYHHRLLRHAGSTQNTYTKI